MGIYNAGYGNFEISDNFLRDATKILYAHKIEIDEFINNSQKLGAVKLLKELTGGGLREAKDVIDLYTAGKLRPSIKEERQKKLERLAKKPLADSITNKILNIEENELNTFLLNLSVDELLLIDEIFPNEEESII